MPDTHTLILTKVMQVEAELSDEEYQEFMESGMDMDWLDAWWSDMDVVERTVEEV